MWGQMGLLMIGGCLEVYSEGGTAGLGHGFVTLKERGVCLAFCVWVQLKLKMEVVLVKPWKAQLREAPRVGCQLEWL